MLPGPQHPQVGKGDRHSCADGLERKANIGNLERHNNGIERKDNKEKDHHTLQKRPTLMVLKERKIVVKRWKMVLKERPRRKRFL